MNDSSIQAIAIVASNLVIMLTFFGVSISLHNGLSRRIDESNKETNKKIDENHKETNSIIRSIHEEMKDFHERLIKIEMDRK